MAPSTKSKGKQAKVTKKFIINASQPASDKIFDVSAFEKFLQDKIKVDGRVGNLGDIVQISQVGDGKIEVVAHTQFSGRYLKYLTKKFLKKQQLRDWLRVVSTSKGVYELRAKMSSLPTPPMEEHKSLHMRRQSSKVSKQLSRSSKRVATPHEHSPIVIDGRHKRVWKACERCRMKKTKCDGESPCKRCKDDGLVCTAGSRKKTEFKQLPRGYAEVLENTQYALIATVQKLYTMVRNNDSWDLGEPELNDRGQPVIHDIASKLGCIRPSPDLPFAFPEGADDFAELQAQLQAARSEMAAEDTGGRRKLSEDSSSYSPTLERTDRASSSESDHSDLSKDYNQMMLAQQSQAVKQDTPTKTNTSNPNARPLSLGQRPTFDQEASYLGQASIDTSRSIPSPIYTDFQTESPPFSPWSAGDDFLGSAHAPDLTTHYMKQQRQSVPRLSPLNPSSGVGLGLEANMLKAIQLNDGMNFSDGTIRPYMLDCTSGFDLPDQMDMIYGGDYESQMGMA